MGISEALMLMDRQLSSFLFSGAESGITVINRYAGCLKEGTRGPRIESIYLDTSSKQLYMLLNSTKFVSDRPVSPDLPFHGAWVADSGDVNTFFDMHLDSRPDIHIKMIKCADFPFLDSFYGSINSGYRVQRINSEGRRFHYGSVTYDGVKSCVQALKNLSSDGGLRGIIIQTWEFTDTYLRVEDNSGSTLVIRSDMTYDQKSAYSCNGVITDQFEMKVVLGIFFGRPNITRLENKSWFENKLGTYIVLDDE